EITDETLYACHKAFYNLKNMVLTVAGNFETSCVLDLCDRLLTEDSSEKITIPHVEEPLEIVRPYSYEKLSVGEPLFQLGFKGIDRGLPLNILAQTTGEILS
ncbi:MAG: insulinase family protein, partial [Oscillospiraceae bacterium]